MERHKRRRGELDRAVSRWIAVEQLLPCDIGTRGRLLGGWNTRQRAVMSPEAGRSTATPDPQSARLASVLQSVLNDLKRDLPSAARDLGLKRSEIEAALRGERLAAEHMRAAILKCWPVSEREVALAVDDTKDGVLLSSSEQALQSARFIERGGAPYYEYRDTAMSRLSPIRPEWIRPLASTAPDPSGDAVKWNRGHALHQFTYFRGDIDFYFEADGIRQALCASEGDSAYIPSFAPHTFVRRNGSSADAHIIAVTFHGRVHGDAGAELAVIPNVMRDKAVCSETPLARRIPASRPPVSAMARGNTSRVPVSVDRAFVGLRRSSPIDLGASRRGSGGCWLVGNSSAPSRVVEAIRRSGSRTDGTTSDAPGRDARFRLVRR